MSSKTSNDAVLDAALREATTAVFSHYGVLLTAEGPSPALRIDAHDAVGVIGFSGDRLRGTLVLATSTALVDHTCPQLGGRPIPRRDRVRDWVGELSNLVLGRVKISLGRRGVVLGLSTPVAFTGEHLRLGAVQRSRTRSWDFASEHGPVRAWLEVDLDAGVLLGTADDQPSEPVIEAGEPLLF